MPRPQVELHVEPPTGPRNRLSTLVRPILAIPHLLLVGGPVVGILGGGFRTGALGLVALTIAFLDWFAIIVTGRPLEQLQEIKRYYLRWRARVLIYSAFLRDEYPPFGEGVYPVVLHVPEPIEARDRLRVALRPLLVIPHLIVLLGLLVAWIFVALASWLVILVTGQLPTVLWRFGRDVMAYVLRVEAYLLLLHDHYPPFLLTEEAEEPLVERPEPQRA
jgi:hypothetical protein